MCSATLRCCAPNASSCGRSPNRTAKGCSAFSPTHQVTEFYAWDRFTDVGQGHELAARTAGQFRQREAIRWGLVLPGAPHIIGTCGYTRWSQENRFAVLGYEDLLGCVDVRPHPRRLGSRRRSG